MNRPITIVSICAVTVLIVAGMIITPATSEATTQQSSHIEREKVRALQEIARELRSIRQDCK